MHRTSWRLTFVAWAVLLVVWGVVTITLGRNSLVLIQRLAGRGDTLVVLTLGVLIAAPLLTDAVRNAPRYRRRWHQRALASDAIWSSRVPATTPRRYRTSGGARLTWRESAIVEQGQLAYGRVERHGELVSVRFDAPWGDTITSLPVITPATPRDGARAPLLFEPGARMGVAPTLHALEFLAAQPRDERRALAAASPQAPSERLAISVRATLHPVERVSRPRSVSIGQLTLEGSRLTLSLARAEPVMVRLDRPFRVELSTHLRSDGSAELNVLVEPRVPGAYRAGKDVPLCFKTELAQERLDKSIPRSWVDAGYVAAVDFDPLWATILAGAGDRELSAAVASS